MPELNYNAATLDHFHNPRNAGDLPGATATGEAVNPACGDRMRLFLRIEDGVITDARFKTFGCIAAIASSSMLTQMLRGRTVADARAITNRSVVDALGGLPESKEKCSVLAEQGLRAALGAPSGATAPNAAEQQPKAVQQQNRTTNG